jgi:uncharacterized protein (TIGR02391 family)
MTLLPCFEGAVLEAACKVLGDTANGLTGDEIGHLIVEIDIDDPDVGATKWKRLYNALAHTQNKHQVGNHLIMFVTRAMAPARYVSRPEVFHWRRDGLNKALAFAGYAVREDGKVVRTKPATTVDEARARAGRLRSILEGRGTHPEVISYCRAELLQENYFHAVLEAIKGLAERIRQMTGLTTDGAELVNEALSTKAPILALNALNTETQISEQRGIAQLLVGLFSAVRNPTAHAPRVTWPMSEQDALDIFALVSFVHRKLDGASKV